MTAFTGFQSTLVLILGLAALACEVFALVDALRHRPDAFVAAGQAHQELLDDPAARGGRPRRRHAVQRRSTCSA